MRRYIFRMTHFRNVERHMAEGSLYARNNPLGSAQYSICYNEIVQRRGTQISTPNGQNINEYVAFYFSPCTVMAFAISQGKVKFKNPNGDDFGPSRNEEVVFYVCNPDRVHNAKLKYLFTNIACNSALAPKFSDDIENLESHVNWPLFDEGPTMARIPEIGYSGACKYANNRDSQPNIKIASKSAWQSF